MEGCYEVYLGKDLAGKVQIIQEGLYCRIICRCQADTDQIYRLYAVSDKQKENLGVLIPDGDGLLLNKRVPLKRFGHGIPEFEISSGTAVQRDDFIPISPEEPFLYIHRLKDSFLQSKNGRIGIRGPKNPEAV